MDGHATCDGDEVMSATRSGRGKVWKEQLQNPKGDATIVYLREVTWRQEKAPPTEHRSKTAFFEKLAWSNKSRVKFTKGSENCLAEKQVFPT